MRRVTNAVLIVVLAGLTVTIEAQAGTSSHARPAALAKTCGALTTPPARYSHVIWIWMENHSYGQIIGPPGSAAAKSSPYVNGTLAPECGLATNYHNVTHPSLPNYLAATSGSTQGLTKDCMPAKCSNSAASLFGQPSSWRSYEESMPVACYRTDTTLYAPKHNPASYYTGLASACKSHDVPMGTAASGRFSHDLNAGTLPAFSFVTPNLCDDTHNCSIATGDGWLKTWVPKITASPAYQSGTTVLFITWDEGAGGSAGESCTTNTSDQSCHVATIVVGAYTPAGTTSAILFNHYALLKTTEQLLGIPTYLGHAGDASTTSMRSAFHL